MGQALVGSPWARMGWALVVPPWAIMGRALVGSPWLLWAPVPGLIPLVSNLGPDWACVLIQLEDAYDIYIYMYKIYKHTNVHMYNMYIYMYIYMYVLYCFYVWLIIWEIIDLLEEVGSGVSSIRSDQWECWTACSPLPMRIRLWRKPEREPSSRLQE